ncbi:MAG: ATP-binding protein [Deltaproteobacteria bacterium]|nr:ATP-binding protein [Deltaproteobacteria bacterium]MBW2361438.1 ATP-binding protein [Deltaproteobacteria bacterium]
MDPAFDIAAFRFDDPFGPSADPARYVPRAATERALAALEARAIGERRCALLAGVPGIGKTLLLRILRARFGASVSVAHLRYAALPAPALFAWALRELDGPGSYDPVGAIAALAKQRAAEGGEIVLLVDDAETLPEDSAQALLEVSRETAGALRFVAAGDRETLGRFASQIEESEPILLVEPMSVEETEAYVRAHLVAANLAEAAHAAFPSDGFAQLQRRAGGIPARVNAEASRLLRRAIGPRVVAPLLKPRLAAARPAVPAIAVAGAEDNAPAPTRSNAGVATGTRAAAPVAAPVVERPLAASGAGAETPRVPAGDEGVGPDAALERAMGRLALAHQRGGEEVSGDAALERATGRLVLSTSAQAGAASGSVPLEPTSAPPTPTAAAPAPVPPTPTAVSTSPRRRRQPPASLAVAVLGASLAAGVLVSVRFLDAQAPAPEVSVAASIRTPLREPAVSAPAPVSAPTPVTVQINARPWAEISIDGVEVGVTPLAGVRVTPGTHRFEARFPDGTLETRQIEIDSARRFVTFPVAAAEAAAQ